MHFTLSHYTSIITRLAVLETRMNALEKKRKSTARLTTGHVIQITFGLAVLGATVLGKMTWPEAFAILKTTIAK